MEYILWLSHCSLLSDPLLIPTYVVHISYMSRTPSVHIPSLLSDGICTGGVRDNYKISMRYVGVSEESVTSQRRESTKGMMREAVMNKIAITPI